MKRAEIKELVAACAQERKLCRVFLSYDAEYSYYFPLIFNDRLFLGAEEDDFLLDGYAIRRFRDVTKAEIKDDLCTNILKREGVVDSIVLPDVDMTSWETIFTSLKGREKNVIVEMEGPNRAEWAFVIGRIEKVYKKLVYIRHFDADGSWQTSPIKIPYTQITSVIFASRYVDTFSKYLSALPDDFETTV